MTKDIKAQVADAQKAFQKFSLETSNEVDKAILTAALKVEADAKRNCPVDMGRLRGSITHRLGTESGETFAEVGTSVFYGPYIEFGTGLYAVDGNGRKTPWKYQDAKGVWHMTSGMRPRPFLTPAYESNKEAIKEYIAKAVKKAADNAGR